jgi:hypothetical protein
LISTTTSGENVGLAAPWELFEAVQAFLEEPLSPLTDHVAPSVETIGDLVVAKAAGGEEDHPSPEDVTIRQRISSSPCFQDRTFSGTQPDFVRT